MAPKNTNRSDKDKMKNTDKTNQKDNSTPTKKQCKSEEAGVRRSHLNQWPAENMPLCLQQWDEQQKGTWKGEYLSIRCLSKKYKIPNTTLL